MNSENKCNERPFIQKYETFTWTPIRSQPIRIKITYLNRYGQNRPVIFWQVEDMPYFPTPDSNIPNIKRVRLEVSYKQPCGVTFRSVNTQKVNIPLGINHGWHTIVNGNSNTNRGLITYRIGLKLEYTGRGSSRVYTSPLLVFEN